MTRKGPRGPFHNLSLVLRARQVDARNAPDRPHAGKSTASLSPAFPPVLPSEWDAGTRRTPGANLGGWGARASHWRRPTLGKPRVSASPILFSTVSTRLSTSLSSPNLACTDNAAA